MNITTPEEKMLVSAYEAVNLRDLDSALGLMTEDVDWPNAMEGGNMIGRQALREYWTHQWTVIDPHVEPVAVKHEDNGDITLTVHQIVKDMDGNLLADRLVFHRYTLRDGLVAKMVLVDHPPYIPDPITIT